MLWTAILQQYSIEMSISPMPDFGIRWVDVIEQSSIIEVPDWAKEGGFVHEPDLWSDLKHPTQNHRSWLRPEPLICNGKQSIAVT